MKKILSLVIVLIAMMSVNAQTFKPQVCRGEVKNFRDSCNYLPKELKFDTSIISKKEYRKLKNNPSSVSSYLFGQYFWEEDKCKRELLIQESWNMGKFSKLDSNFYKTPEPPSPPF